MKYLRNAVNLLQIRITPPPPTGKAATASPAGSVSSSGFYANDMARFVDAVDPIGATWS